MILLEIVGKPVPWASPKGGRHGYYDPRHEVKEQARWQLRGQFKDEFIRGPVLVDFTFFVPIPKGTSSVRRRQMLAHIIKPITKPDTTNYIKLYEDTLKGIVLHDDNIVTDIQARKRYSEVPRTVIRVICLNNNVDQPYDLGEIV